LLLCVMSSRRVIERIYVGCFTHESSKDTLIRTRISSENKHVASLADGSSLIQDNSSLTKGVSYLFF
ncbi:uncharacterized protein V6R79_006995, partial [Siganus canaliculatus]